MTPPPSPLRPVLEVVGFLVAMVVLLGAVGAGVGVPELLIWLLLVVAGTVVITRAYFRRRARWYARLGQPSA